MKKQVSSKEVIKYLKENLTKKYVKSVFVSGSIPKFLEPKSDLDIFIIMNYNYKNEFFNDIKKIMDDFIEENSSIIYSFYRGPIKYKSKGLIHFIIYTDVITKDKVFFGQEYIQILKTFRKRAKVIYGNSIEHLFKKINLRDFKRESFQKSKIRKKYNFLRTRNLIYYKEWKNIGGDWRLRKVWKRPSKFLKDYLIKYYEKNLK